MKGLRTPDEGFVGLPDFDFKPQYLDHQGWRVHCLDLGPRNAAVTALCLHGNPTWGYLYRHMLPVFRDAGLRVVVPDLIGFGRSDKPLDESTHDFDFHRGMLLRLVETLELRNTMLVCQDWGGLLGLTLPLDMPERGKPDMSAAEAAAYDAPFPDARYKAAVRAFPGMVPDGDAAPGAAVSREAARFWRERWSGESFMAIGMQDPVLGGPAMQSLRKLIRGCPPPLEVPEGGHFLPEWGAPIARAALRHFKL